MKFSIHIRSALLSLKNQKTRSLLTTLGIIIGVMTIITMVSIIEGVNNQVYKTLGSLGSNIIYIQKYKWMMMGGSMNSAEWRNISRRKDFTERDVILIEKLPSISEATLTQSIGGQNVKITYRDKEAETREIVGGTPKYIRLCGYEIEKGRTFVDVDLSFRQQTCIIGASIVEKLFRKGEDPLGKNISLGPNKFLVVGILKEKGSLMGQNLDNLIIVPLTTLQKLIKWRSVWNSAYILAQAKNGHTVEEAQEDIEEVLRSRRGCRFNEDNNFELNTQEMILDAYKKITSGIFLAMIGIASLALLVGGIGIMNIMLVSVVERTREIGIRIAVGAKRKDILLQFLIEASVLTISGGVIGVATGFGLAKLISGLTPLPASTPFWSILVGLGFSLFVGIFFGIYPANKASKLNPIEALKYE
ncbi:MAG: ABC transporter permease [bacterium]|nr:ABC transporter permease [bacterium]